MTRTNKYKKFSRISEAKFRQLLKLFCLDLTAVQITEITLLNRNTVNRYLKNIREGPWGVGSGSEELNGTFDMMGNVWELMESPYGRIYSPEAISGSRSGSYYNLITDMNPTDQYQVATYSESSTMGFRVASVPEPTTLLLLGLGGLMVRRRRTL